MRTLFHIQPSRRRSRSLGVLLAGGILFVIGFGGSGALMHAQLRSSWWSPSVSVPASIGA
jgi:hypothetical protein